MVAVADTSGTIYDPPNGLSVAKAIKAKNETGKVVSYEGARRLAPPQDALTVDADVLMPSAI